MSACLQIKQGDKGKSGEEFSSRGGNTKRSNQEDRVIPK